MSDYLVANIICFILLGFLLITIHAMVYRWLFIRPLTLPCPSEIFNSLVLNEAGAVNWSALYQYWKSRSVDLGWLNDCLNESTASAALAKAEEIGNEQDSYLQPLILICSLSTLFGLLGTVGAFLVSDDVNEVAFSTAFRTTALGILVSMPPAFYIALTHNARSRFDKQFDRFVDFAHQFATKPQAVRVVAKEVKPQPVVVLPPDLTAPLVAPVIAPLVAPVTSPSTSRQPTQPPPIHHPGPIHHAGPGHHAGPDYVHGMPTGYLYKQSDAESVARQALEGGSA